MILSDIIIKVQVGRVENPENFVFLQELSNTCHSDSIFGTCLLDLSAGAGAPTYVFIP